MLTITLLLDRGDDHSLRLSSPIQKKCFAFLQVNVLILSIIEQIIKDTKMWFSSVTYIHSEKVC